MNKGWLMVVCAGFVGFGIYQNNQHQQAEAEKSRVALEKKVLARERKARLRDLAKGYDYLNKTRPAPKALVREQELCELYKIARAYQDLDVRMSFMTPFPTPEEQTKYGINRLRGGSPNVGIEEEVIQSLRTMMASGKLIGYCENKDPIEFFEELERRFFDESDEPPEIRPYLNKLLHREVNKVREEARREFLSKEEDWANMPNRSRLCALADKAVKEWGFTLEEVGIERHLLDGGVY